MKNKLFLVWIVLTLAAVACVCSVGNGGSESSGGNGGSRGNDGSGGSGGSGGGTSPPSIGELGLVTSDVEHNQNPVTSREPFFNNDSIGLKNGGEGRLDFVGGLSLSLFNDTLVGDIQSKAASGSSLLARMRLEYGGFTGSLTSGGSSVGFMTPSGATITVYGTDFFIVYNPATSITAVGNFHGRLEVRSGGGSVLPVPENTFRLALPSGEITPESPLHFSKSDFEEVSRKAGSPVAALDELRVTVIEPEPIPVDVTPPGFELLGLDPRSIVYGSECPGSVGETHLTMRIVDESPIARAYVEWELNGVVDSREMERIDDQTFSVLIGPLKDYGVLNIYVYAEDSSGNLGKFDPIQVKVEYCIG